jgi:dihydroneopterin aldolase
MDAIFLRDLTVQAIVGVKPDERVERQPLVLNVELRADLSAACRSDRLEDTVNYKQLQDRIVKEAETSHCLLIERLAQRVADLCLEEPMVKECTVTVDKPCALRFTRSAAVTITRSRV